ncbi:MAG: NAD-dependent epimerase/dehydratase family protein [Chloroflexi bacterium]|nr:NAD-dependent epimerase/dehydratase family protein [Chloroflexota bacterium]
MPSLITGGLGFIGSHLARNLVAAGETVVLFDLIPRSRLVDDIRGRVAIVQGDLANWALLLDAVSRHRIDAIYHTAALLSAAAEESPLAAYSVNAGGTFHVLEAAKLFGVKRVIFLSTIATFGPGLPERVSDDAPQRPTTMYGVTKVFSERLGEYYHRKFGVNFRGVRLPSVIGPGRGGGGVSAYSSLVVQEPAAGRPYEVFVDEATRIPLLYINDAVRALVQLGQAREEQLKRRVYNIQGFSPTAGELADAVRKNLPQAVIRFKPVPEMVQIARSWPRELDDTNARREWGWETRYRLEGTVEDFVKEYKKNKHLYD